MTPIIRTLGITLFSSVLFLLTSCSRGSTVVVSGGTANRTSLPPGQAKKVYGGSAKDYAPGQQKKNSGTTVVVRN